MGFEGKNRRKDTKKAVTFKCNCLIFKWCHQESNNTIQSPNLQHFNIFGKIPEPLNQPYAKFTNFR